MTSWLDTACAVCGRTLNSHVSHCTHARLGKSWCMSHTQADVNAALGEDVSMHTLYWQVSEDDR